MEEKQSPNMTELIRHAFSVWWSKTRKMLRPANPMRRYWCAISFVMVLKGIKRERNLKRVMEIQKIEVYLRA
jgi:hypothetical protein